MAKNIFRYQRTFADYHKTEPDDPPARQGKNLPTPIPAMLGGQSVTSAALRLQDNENSSDRLRPQDILQLQSTIGNRKVKRALVAPRKSASTTAEGPSVRQRTGASRKPGVIQRAVILPDVGTFDTKIYQPFDRQYDAFHNSQIPQEMTDRQVGAKILIEFTPDAHFELANGNTISLIQTVRETIAKTAKFGVQDPENVELMRENNTGGFPLRSVTDGTDDSSWLIDHQLFSEQVGVMPPAGNQNAAIASYATARGNAILALANFPNELALVQTTPNPLAMNPPPYGSVRKKIILRTRTFRISSV